MGRKCIDLTGQKFGRLTVIERAENKGIQVCWLCKCECGNEKVIRGSDLKSGATMSCGCWNSEKTKKQWQDEDFRKMKSEKTKEQWQDKDFRKMQSEKTKEKWQDKDFRKMQSERMKAQMKEKWQDENFRQIRSEVAKEQWQDEEFRKMHSEKGKQKTKDKNPNYKGGITPISQYLRSLYGQWFDDCKKQVNYTCQLTGKTGVKLNTHHLKAFSTIVLEAHELHNIQIKEIVTDYTEEELKLLEEYVGSWHKDNSNAVVLSENVHMLFHSLYGKGENTPEQFEEFRERYMAGEFKEILK